MQDITNLKAFCEGLTEAEKEFLVRAEFIKLKQLLGALTPAAFLNLTEMMNKAGSVENAPPALVEIVRGSATSLFENPLLLQDFEKILKLRAANEVTFGRTEVIVLNLALEDPDNFTSITGPMSATAERLSNLGYGEIRNHIPGEQIQFRPNKKAKLKMQN